MHTYQARLEHQISSLLTLTRLFGITVHFTSMYNVHVDMYMSVQLHVVPGPDVYVRVMHDG